MSGLTSTPTVQLIVLTCEAVLFEGEVAWVQVPLSDGLIGIWPEHMPLVGELGVGSVRFAVDDQVRELPVTGGVLHVREDECAVLLQAGGGAPETELDSERLFATLELALLDLVRDGGSSELSGELQGDAELDSVDLDRVGE